MATTSTFNQIFCVGANELFITRGSSYGGNSISHIGSWNGGADTIAPVGVGLNNLGLAVCRGGSDGQVFVGGTFTATGNSSLSLNRVAYFDGSSWSNLGASSWFDEDVTSLAYDWENDKLYVASHGTTTSSRRISLWDGNSWSGISTSFTANTYVKLCLDSEQTLYAGYSSTLKKYSGGTWTDISTSIGGSINDLKYDPINNRVYIMMSSGSPKIKYYSVANNSITSLTDISGTGYALTVDKDGELYVAIWPSAGYVSSIAKYNFGSSSWTNLFNYQSVSGVLDVEIDSNGNIFAYGNSGGFIVGVAPYSNGNWQAFSATTAISLGGYPSPESSANSYDEVGAGGCTAGGSAPIALHYTTTPNGGCVAGGSANYMKVYNEVTSGGIVVSPISTSNTSYFIDFSGGSKCSGNSSVDVSIRISENGVLLGGEAIVTMNTPGVICWESDELTKTIRAQRIMPSNKKWFRIDKKAPMVAAITICAQSLEKKFRK